MKSRLRTGLGILLAMPLLLGVQCHPEELEPVYSAALGSITVNAGSLSPPFSPGTLSYTVEVGANVKEIEVIAVPADALATVSYAPAQPVALEVGETPITITVTAADNVTLKTYVVTVHRSSVGYVSPFVGQMVHVPAGAFQRDEAVTNVTAVTAFFVSQYPITQERYTMVTGGNPSYFRNDEDPYDRPVETVSWYDAIVFCNLLSEIEGRTPVYTILGFTNPEEWGPVPRNTPDLDWDSVTMDMEADGYRLPTEAEWMWAAMGAASGAGYPGSGTFRTGWRKEFAGDPNPTRSGDPIDDYAWYGSVANPQGTATEARTYKVGLKLPNELGLYDMSGNVWEWTWDWLAPYPDGPLTDPVGPATGVNRVSRGGSWYDAASFQSVAFRGLFSPMLRGNRHGTFRVVTR